MLDAEEVELQGAIESTKERLKQTRAELRQLRELLGVENRVFDEQAVFIGSLVEFVRIQRTIAGDGDLAREIVELAREERELKDLVDAQTIEQRKEDALLLISRYAHEYGALVELEQNEATIKLDTKALTVRILNDRGDSAWLYQIGSGANHLGYHVAVMLALHDFFIRRGVPYVPSFIAFDQPSQTQFPDDLDEEAEHEEVLAVRKAFEAFSAAITRTSGALQIIVSEHASKGVSEGIKHIHLVERWRRGRKLIPWHWDPAALDGLEGKRADFALEDSMSDVVRPSVQDHLGAASILDTRILRAHFRKRSIEFELLVTAEPPSDGSTAGPPVAIRGRLWPSLVVALTVVT